MNRGFVTPASSSLFVHVSTHRVAGYRSPAGAVPCLPAPRRTGARTLRRCRWPTLASLGRAVAAAEYTRSAATPVSRSVSSPALPGQDRTRGAAPCPPPAVALPRPCPALLPAPGGAVAGSARGGAAGSRRRRPLRPLPREAPSTAGTESEGPGPPPRPPIRGARTAGAAGRRRTAPEM